MTQIVTANLLREGHVVYLTATGDWTRELAKAALFDADAEDALARANAQSDLVVGPYLAKMRASPQGPQPTHFREEFRRDGPSAAARLPEVTHVSL